MPDIHQLQQLVNQAIAEKNYPDGPAELYNPVSYFMALGGKRLRPVMLLLSADLFGGSITGCLDPAVAVELFHNFTLMHDDIMDKAPLRRGHTTVHEKWNGNTAILSGDVMLVEAYALLTQVADVHLKKVLTIFNQTAEGVCRGQQMDMNFEQVNEVTLPQYLEMIRLKTAVLLAGSMKIGAILSSADPGQADLIYRFGEQLGMAFQVQDDILDVYGDRQKFGKQTGGDILSNKKTWLLIKSQEVSEGIDAEELNHWLTAEDEDPAEKIRAVTALYTRLGVRTLAEEEMTAYAETALQALEEITADKAKKDRLRHFAEQLLVREN